MFVRSGVIYEYLEVLEIDAEWKWKSGLGRNQLSLYTF